jgi:hypothetical protein
MTGDDQVAARVEAELRAQGLADALDDQITRQVVALLSAGDDHKRARCLDQVRRELAQLEVPGSPVPTMASVPSPFVQVTGARNDILA